MRMLLSAYACMPGVGSEPGVGWRWALSLARSHSVVVITHQRFRAAIEAYVRAHSTEALPEFHYHDTPLLRVIPFNGATALPKYFVWQCSVMPLAHRLMRRMAFDLVVHLTMCTFRYPSWMGYLGAPFAIGPVGGGESAPRALLAGLPFPERVFEALRSLLIISARCDPILWLSQRKARLVLTRSSSTTAALPWGIARRAVTFLDIGSEVPTVAVARRRDTRMPLRLVMVARLLGWKGVHLALLVAAKLKRRDVSVTLDVIGDGRLLGWLTALRARENVVEEVSFLGQLSPNDVELHLRRADLFLFPSLHDSGGMAVLEALGCGLPVVCLDLGGPAIAVTPACGLVVAGGSASQSAVIERLADAVEGLAADEDRRRALAEGALARACELSWSRSLSEGQRLFEACAVEGASRA